MELGPILAEFYAPKTSSERKQQIERELHAFRTLPNAHITSLEIIVATVRSLILVAFEMLFKNFKQEGKAQQHATYQLTTQQLTVK